MYHQFVLLPNLQRIKNAWARLIFREQKFCHVTSPSHNCFQSDVFSQLDLPGVSVASLMYECYPIKEEQYLETQSSNRVVVQGKDDY